MYLFYIRYTTGGDKVSNVNDVNDISSLFNIRRCVYVHAHTRKSNNLKNTVYMRYIFGVA